MIPGKKIPEKIVHGKMALGKISSDSSEKLGFIFFLNSNLIKIVICMSTAKEQKDHFPSPLAVLLCYIPSRT